MFLTHIPNRLKTIVSSMSTTTGETLYSESRSGASSEYQQDGGPVGDAYDLQFIDDELAELQGGLTSEEEAVFTDDDAMSEDFENENEEDEDDEEETPSAKAEEEPSFTSKADNDLICPITLCLMKDPVCAADGFSYERAALVEHLKRKKTSPKTNKRMAAKFYENRTLKAVIETFKGEQHRAHKRTP